MDFKFFQSITEEMRFYGVEEIGLFYLGESFMNVELLEKAIRWCKKRMGFPYVFLTSNAVLADTKSVMAVMRAGLDSLKWSVNAATPEQFKEITGKPKDLFDKAISNIQFAHKLRNAGRREGQLNTVLSASSILYEGKQKEKMQQFLDEQIIPYVDTHYWLPLYQMSMYRDRLKTELGYMPTAGNMGRIDEETMLPNRKPLPCWSAFTEGHVRADGGLSACCFGSDDRFDMGKLGGENNFMLEWNSRKFQLLRQAQIDTLTEGQGALKGTVCEVCVGYNESN
jgi:MoaA/NifB/PqqE/SkfB family radical SAM enzyme